MANSKKILYITGTRADFGLMQSVLGALDSCPEFSVELLATGMHLMPQFGNTIEQVRASGYPVHQLDAVFQQDNKSSMAAFLGEVTRQGTALVESIQPDMILLLGDRAEMLAGAIIGAYMYLPTIHIGGGDNTSTIDNSVRHAITRLAHLHFAATDASRERLVESGESEWRCFNAGAPALDAILDRSWDSREDVYQRLGLESELPVQVVILHPESLHEENAAGQMKLVLDTCLGEEGSYKAEFNGESSNASPPSRAAAEETSSDGKSPNAPNQNQSYQTVVIYPNADAGGRQMIEVIESYRGRTGFSIFPSLPYNDYLHLLKHADLLIGNSSSGILEAPSFGLPVLNVGDRQRGREKAENILDVPFEAKALKEALQKARTDQRFLENARQAQNPYANGGCGRKIVDTLREIEWDDRWLQK